MYKYKILALVICLLAINYLLEQHAFMLPRDYRMADLIHEELTKNGISYPDKLFANATAICFFTPYSGTDKAKSYLSDGGRKSLDKIFNGFFNRLFESSWIVGIADGAPMAIYKVPFLKQPGNVSECAKVGKFALMVIPKENFPWKGSYSAIPFKIISVTKE
jgi:hypothetical protein